MRPTPSGPERSTPPRKRKKRRPGLVILLLILILVLAWPIGLMMWASSKIEHINALSGAADTPGTTYLLAGSDARDGTEILDDTEGRRADTIMLLHKAPNGNSYLVSIPRDTWVDVPGYGEAKINASYAYGGEAGLVETVEGTTGLTVDHFVEVGMSGVTDIVDSMGGIELCLDYDVDDPKSELVWESGCHLADGHTALAFARMRYSDPKGDIGRAERQRQVIGSVVKTAAQPKNLLNPIRQKSISKAAAGSVVTDPDTSSFELAKMAWYFKKATSSGNSGAPPIATINLETYQGSAVLLDEDLAPQFFQKLATGDLKPEDFNVTTY
ncbi:MAG: LCP family protein [Gleimia sp.]|jgi:LCP family protein required for cell wall assembly